MLLPISAAATPCLFRHAAIRRRCFIAAVTISGYAAFAAADARFRLRFSRRFRRRFAMLHRCLISSLY